jgi:hypothetical protein
MLNKPADVLYCGVREDKIKSAEPFLDEDNLRHLYNFITRRYKVHLRKDVLKKPRPWTQDPVLQEFRFTNVRREHDRESLWLINHITSNPKVSYEDKLMNCILFRLFNKHETSELISQPIKFNAKYEPEAYRSLFEARVAEDPKFIFFTGAFITGGMKRALKWYLKGAEEDNMPMRVMKFMKHLQEDNIVGKIKACKDQKAVYDLLRSYLGIGDFLAYQMFVDMTYIEEFPFSENEFTAAGPGCKMGLGFLFVDKDGMSHEECIFWVRNNIGNEFRARGWKWDPEKLFVDLPQHDRCLNVMSLENCFCELSKYIRAITGTGRPRKKYVPTKE